MSGGVDSSLTAALLRAEGYEVIGVTMQIWPVDDPEQEQEHGGCCSNLAVEDARKVANFLDIPFYVMNFRDLFEVKVIKPFISEYLSGRTPNPCIACNRFIKFDSFLSKAMGLGADYIATGHYARIGFSKEDNRYTICRARDNRKDQSYVLYNMNQEQLKRTMMPLGEYTKDEVRRMAENYKLGVAHKPESQEICFVTDNDYHRFLRENAGEVIKPGPFLDTNGNVLGQHQGMAYYTVGQRKGLGVTFGEPMYVVALDPGRNAVILGKNDEVFGKELLANDNNIILYEDITEPLTVHAKIRYAAKPAEALLIPLSYGKIKVRFSEPQRAITPGQAVVYYKGDCVVGGGTIEEKL
ncbi:tRNA 2-thiouridine(34) synthase MnmA [Phosphitispora sp. TUW77]|uniref:tRNA 2-thiouridine(34) synthase MnmA n=1 Tax=Phosphitispora sp. TUW77 TaxID=3152361 RepID=UPI003AB1323B